MHKTLADSVVKTVSGSQRLYNADCKLCKQCTDTIHVCTQGRGISGGLMLIGTSPDETEDETDDIFTSPSHMYLRDVLLPKAGLCEEDIRFTHAVRCVGSNPSVQSIIKCYPYLEAEIKKHKPKVIGVLGNVALASVMWFAYKKADKKNAKVSGIMKWRGLPIWHKAFNCWVIPMPSAKYIWNAKLEGYYHETQLAIHDLELMNEYLNKPMYTPKNVKSVVVTTVKKAQAVMDQCAEKQVFAYDIETGGKGEELKYIIGCSFATSSKIGYYMHHDLLVSDLNLYKSYRRILKDPRNLKIMHNGAFETRVHALSGRPIFTRKYWDTMIGAQMLDENFPVNLKDLAWRLTDYGGYDLKLDQYKKAHKIKEDYSEIPFEIISIYGGLDATATFALYEYQKKHLKQEGLIPLFTKITMPARAVASKAEINGFNVDIEWVNYLIETGEKAMHLLEEKVYGYAGKEFNINSRVQLGNILYKEMGLKPLRKTATGYSVDAESIDYVASQANGQIAKSLSDHSYLKTLIGTHAKQAQRLCGSDGRVHTHFNFTGTVTGRLSASKPSLQNVPNDSYLRSIYVPSKGRVLIEADLKSAELAYLSAVSGEEVFLRAFREGRDLHADTYNLVMGLNMNNIPTKAQRQLAKKVNFGLVYGISAYGLAKMLHMTPEEVEDFMVKYFEMLPMVALYLEQSDIFVKEHGYVVSLFNRKRRLPDALGDDAYAVARACRQAKNAPVQSGASDYTQNGIVRTDRAMLKAGVKSDIIHTVQDCVIIDAVPEEVDMLTKLVRVAFETPLKILPVRMKIDIDVISRWGEGNESRVKNIFESVGFTTEER